MVEPSFASAMTDLKTAAAIQTEAAHLPLCFEWGEIVLARLRQLWRRLEDHEALAYEDKVAAQVRLLQEATASLWHLHKALVATRRDLVRHRRSLQRGPAKRQPPPAGHSARRARVTDQLGVDGGSRRRAAPVRHGRASTSCGPARQP
jgi:hypothetical protein